MAVDEHHLEKEVEVFYAIHGLKFMQSRQSLRYHNADDSWEVFVLHPLGLSYGVEFDPRDSEMRSAIEKFVCSFRT